MTPRPAVAEELPGLAVLWHDIWHETHGQLLPEAAPVRTVEEMAARLSGYGEALRVLGPVGAPIGLCVVQADELHQIYVGRQARGTQAAGLLLADGEARIAASGHKRAWLGAAVGNDRAIRFYERNGWVRRGVQTVMLASSGAPVSAEVLVMDKDLI